MRINLARLQRDILALGKIGRTAEGGVSRRAFTPADLKGREFLTDRLQAAGFTVRQDAAGNLIGRYPGQEDRLPCIMIGSHIDTVPNGGIFDGALGVLGGLECVRSLQELCLETRHPIEVVAFAAEEGSSLGGTFGSRAMAGRIEWSKLTEREKTAIDLNLQAYNLSGPDLSAAKRGPESIKAFVELHIEQGKVLEDLGIPIGLVSGIVGIYRHEVTVTGEANHAGSTPMTKRNDALVKAARLILALREFTVEENDEIVGTVGTIAVKPNAINVIPGEAKFTVELRDINAWGPVMVLERLKSFAAGLGGVEFRRIAEKEPVRLHPGIQDKIRTACRSRGIEYHLMPSAAGHDAVAMSYITPTAMLFVPSRGGISHSPQEWTDWEDVERGTEVLLHTVLAIDES